MESTPDFPELQGRRTNIGRRLLNAFQAFEAFIVQGLHERGFPDFRPTHAACLRNLDWSGNSVTELARRARMTKQGMSLLVQELERLGYLRRGPHPLDGRVKVVTFTARGRRLIEVGRDVNAELNRLWAEALGPHGLAQLLELLQKVPEVEERPPAESAATTVTPLAHDRPPRH